MALICKGHLIDPLQLEPFTTLTNLRRGITRHTELQDTWESIHNHFKDNYNPNKSGPVTSAIHAAKQCNWEWSTPYIMESPGLPPLHFLQGSSTWWKHQIRDGVRQALFTRIAKLGKRKDMQGISALEILGTTILLRNSSHLCHDLLNITHLQDYLHITLPLPAFETGALEAVIAGATRTGTRLYAADMIDDPSCRACGHHEETIEHMFWDCPATEHLRPHNILELRQTKTQQPHMWATCSLMRRQ